MFKVQNNTPFSIKKAFFPNENAVDTLYIMVRASFNIADNWTLLEEQVPPVQADKFWTGPVKSSLRYPSDYHIGKLSSDIIMLGHAFVPEGESATRLDVSLKVGKVKKTVRVFGDRQWINGVISQPKEFKSMAMVYEKAYGGMYISKDNTVYVESRNPVGRGYAGNRRLSEMNGIYLPNLETPDNLINNINDEPFPACFAAGSAHWQPRASYAGTYDDRWRQHRAPYLPEDFDKRFLSMAHPDLIYPGFLKGGETVEINNMHIKGDIKFTIPKVRLNADVIINKKSIQPEFNLETLLIEPNQLKLSLLWRAAVECDKSMLKVRKITLSTRR